MAHFRQRRGRILLEIVGAFLIASAAAARGVVRHSIISLIVAAAIVLYGIYRSVMLFTRNPALAYDEKCVRVGRLARIDQHHWDRVRDIREAHWERPSIPFLNWLPKERDYIELLIDGAGPLKIRPDMIELPAGGVKQIIKDFRAAQAAVLGERGAARARLGEKQADNSTAPVSAAQAERWRRLGITMDTTEDGGEEKSMDQPASVQLSHPLRPAFGRKTT
jgi:hypothetical protein